MAQTLFPAVQYLRMSTDHQQYSLAYQADAIARFAETHAFTIVKTYSDPAKSGLSLKRRSGLKQLLKDTVDGHSGFQAILVYDVSRWGRFQDADEAAHYEYLCRSSGVPVYYCAELFPDDPGFAGALMKALKRTMAGEYSRELSAKVRSGLTLLARQGYKAGGTPPYGLRRQLLDCCGNPVRTLAAGERKNLVTDHVILIPGPSQEVKVVERIFREFADEHCSMRAIAKRLNSEGVPYNSGHPWNANTIRRILKQPNYVGAQVWGRTTEILSSKPKPVDPLQWVVCPNAFEPITDAELFDRAQARFRGMTHNLTDEDLLDRARKVFAEHGRLTSKLMDESRICPGATTYWNRFRGLLNLYARLGFDSEHGASIRVRQRLLMIRNGVINDILQTFPHELEEFRPKPRYRALLRYRKTGLLISVLMAKYKPTTTGKRRWFIYPPPTECKRVAIVAFLSEDNTSVQQLRVFPNTTIFKAKAPMQATGKRLLSGTPVAGICDLLGVIQRVRACPSSHRASSPTNT